MDLSSIELIFFITSWFDPFEYCKYFIFAVNKNDQRPAEHESLKGAMIP